MTFEREEKEESIRLKCEGTLSIYEAAGLQEEVLACLEKDLDLELDLGGVTGCDMAGLQLLYAARKTAIKEQKVFAITDTPQTVLDALQGAGLRPDELL